MTYTSVKLDAPFFHSVEDRFFPYQCCSSISCLSSRRGVRGADHTDAERGIDGVGQAHTVSDNGTVLCGAQSYGEIVFTGCRIPAYFKGADIAMKVLALEKRESVQKSGMLTA